MSGVQGRFRSRESNRETDEHRIALIQKIVSSPVANARVEALRLRDRFAQERRSRLSLVEESEAANRIPASALMS
jgi:hypothetical protein